MAKLEPECIVCFLRQIVQTGRISGMDTREINYTLREAMTEIQKIEWTGKPADLSPLLHNIIKKHLGTEDPYRHLKEEWNSIAMKIYPEIKNRVERSPTPLLTAIKMAVAGNVIDFGAYESFDLMATIEDVMKKDFSIFDYNQLKDALKKGGTILFLGDNSGEIVFDRILIEYIIERYNLEKVVYAVKSQPVLNDAMLQDAIQIGMDTVDEVEIIEIAPHGTSGLSRGSEEFNEYVHGFDTVISKGQANYEYLADTGGIFFLFMVKCNVIARDISAKSGKDVKNGDIILWYR